MYELTRHEELILVAIWRLGENAYIVSIRKNIRAVTGKTIHYGSMCNTLSALVRKGYLSSKESQPVAQQGGRRKILYNLTSEGKEALKHAYKLQMLTWKGFSEFVTEFR